MYGNPFMTGKKLQIKNDKNDHTMSLIYLLPNGYETKL